MTDRNLTPDDMTPTQIAAATCEDPHETIRRLQEGNEELIRGMTEIGQRYSAAMDGAADQIKHLRATIGQIETILVRDSAAKDQAGNIDKRNFVGQAILLCRKAG